MSDIPSARSGRHLVAFVASCMGMAAISIDVLLPAFPEMREEFGLAADSTAVGSLITAFFLGLACGQLLYGPLSDKYGRKPLLIMTIRANGLCYLALAFAPNAWAAFAIRLAGGLFSGNGSIIQGYIADVTPPEKRTRSMSWMGAAWNVGLIVGPFLGGVFAKPKLGPIGFQLPLFIAAGLFMTSALAIALFIRESRQREESNTFRPNRWAATGEAVRHPVIGRLMLVTFLVGFAFTGIESIFGLWTEARYGWGPKEIGWAFMFVGVASAITQIFLTGRLSERFGQATMLAIGMAITVVCLALQPFSTGGPMTIALMSLSAVGQSVAWPNVSALISETADPHRQGQILGLNNATGALARVSGPLCAGLSFPLNIHAPFIQGAFVVLPAIFLAAAAGRRAQAWRAAGRGTTS